MTDKQSEQRDWAALEAERLLPCRNLAGCYKRIDNEQDCHNGHCWASHQDAIATALRAAAGQPRVENVGIAAAEITKLLGDLNAGKAYMKGFAAEVRTVLNRHYRTGDSRMTDKSDRNERAVAGQPEITREIECELDRHAQRADVRMRIQDCLSAHYRTAPRVENRTVTFEIAERIELQQPATFDETVPIINAILDAHYRTDDSRAVLEQIQGVLTNCDGTYRSEVDRTVAISIIVSRALALLPEAAGEGSK